jgi:hypothetical protein
LPSHASKANLLSCSIARIASSVFIYNPFPRKTGAFVVGPLSNFFQQAVR